MKKYSFKPKLFIGILIIGLLCSCASFKPGWNEMAEKSSSSNVKELLEKAFQLEYDASTKEDVLAIIGAYQDVEKADPANYHALWKIGNYYILMGAAHADKTKEKKKYYRQAIKYCEKAMYTNDDFIAEIDKGAEITEASEVLTINEVNAMGYWYTARFYYFKECIKPLGRLFNTKIIIENNKMIDDIDKLDPDWAGGGNYFSRALYYIAVPEKFGGSKEKAAEEFQHAIEAGPEYLVNRWGRAKYLYDLLGDEEALKEDLEWVIAQDPYKAGNPHAWNVYFQEDAKKLLAEKQH